MHEDTPPRRPTREGPQIDYVTLLAVFVLALIGVFDITFSDGGKTDAVIAAIGALVFRLYPRS